MLCVSGVIEVDDTVSCLGIVGCIRGDGGDDASADKAGSLEEGAKKADTKAKDGDDA